MIKWISFLSFLSISVLLNAQQFEGGLVGGLSASQVDGDFTKGFHKPGVIFGGYVQTDLSRSVFAGMEIRYAQKGSRRNPDTKTGDQSKYIMRLGYMDIPVYMGFRTSETISFLGGLSAGYLMHSKELDNFGEFPEEDQRPFNNFDFQALLGMRVALTNRLDMDLRFAYSFMPIRDLAGDITWYWWDDQYNNVISTAVYYRLGK